MDDAQSQFHCWVQPDQGAAQDNPARLRHGDRAHETHRILGTGAYAPEKVLTNADLEKMVETSDAWITNRTGIKERRIAAPGELTSDMAVKAAVPCAGDGAHPGRGAGPDRRRHHLPGHADAVHRGDGAGQARREEGLRLRPLCGRARARCTGCPSPTSTSAAAACSRALVLGRGAAEPRSWTGPTGTPACSSATPRARWCSVRRRTRTAASSASTCTRTATPPDILTIPGGGSLHPQSAEVLEKKLNKVAMNGREVYKYAVRALPEAVLEALGGAGPRPRAT